MGYVVKLCDNQGHGDLTCNSGKVIMQMKQKFQDNVLFFDGLRKLRWRIYESDLTVLSEK